MKSVAILNRCLLVLLFFMLSACFKKQDVDIDDEMKVAEDFEVTFRYRVTNIRDSVIYGEMAKFSLPIAHSARHEVQHIDTNVGGKFIELSGGNREFYVDFERLLPREVKIVTISVRYSELPAKQPVVEHELTSSYLAETHFIPFSQPQFSKLISELKGTSVKETVAKSYQWVVSNISYSGYSPNIYGAAYALKYRKGDCTEFTYLLGALLRGNGIPTRLVSGYVLESNGILNAADFHSWVEVDIDGVWQVVDAQRRHFGHSDQAYFSMSYLDGESKEQRFSSSENVRVVMF
ncbi:transglutaminase-like domain-containing protein [Shewanella algae]|uniref:transglutaminase-like domain-containing protein n=1 Tax=Shewanella algae TaxID=38313 RepID=UPI000BB5DC12|nr:transglutaminase domain-containing protein [Shewanella algae]MBO2627037.1 transglutaminase domain-containing protein [Shewanella algae]MBO2647314.1 transglutaminase domain-containing protein [Shewanella algae]MCE9775888.1 transglutaminase domain-containing protein [Shewanella algae]PBQ25252.1 hypothetical protein AYI97_20700 [Shewanella algae]QNH97473.1 transglutaminase domain-containing protein [Shewanella algae]